MRGALWDGTSLVVGRICLRALPGRLGLQGLQEPRAVQLLKNCLLLRRWQVAEVRARQRVCLRIVEGNHLRRVIHRLALHVPVCRRLHRALAGAQAHREVRQVLGVGLPHALAYDINDARVAQAGVRGRAGHVGERDGGWRLLRLLRLFELELEGSCAGAVGQHHASAIVRGAACGAQAQVRVGGPVELACAIRAGGGMELLVGVPQRAAPDLHPVAHFGDAL
mmetsp:Transcript_83/g.263  ORF Transcript_83/g.263 Transcript_83/m.263 type:complete len:223 (-) Transcript_83:198-866(-)